MRYFSIYIKLIIYFLLISVPPILIMGVLSFVEVTRIVRGETERVLSLIAQSTANQIGRALDENMQDVLLWAMLSDVGKSLDQRTLSNQRRLQDLLDQLVMTKSGYDILMVVDVNGRLRAVNKVGPEGQRLISGSVMERDWMSSSNEWSRGALAGEPVLGPWHYDSQIEMIYAHEPRSYSIIMSAPIRRKGGSRVIGVFAAYLNWMDIQRQLDRVREDVVGVYNVNLALITADGRKVIGYRNRERYGDTYLERAKLPPEAFSAAKSTFGFSSPLKRTLAYATVEVPSAPQSPSWLVCVDVLDRDIFAATFQLRDTFLLITGLAVFAIIGMVNLVSRMITRPLLMLVDDAAAVAKGDLDREIKIDSVDEIGVLQNAFHLMTDAIRERDRKLQEIMHDLERANRLKSEFLANMSHELRTPMNSIIGFTSLTIDRAGDLLPPLHRENLLRVKKNAHNLLELLNGILDLSKIESGGMDIFVEPFEVGQLIDSIMTMVHPMLDKNSVRIERRLPDDLSPLRQDRTKVRQILVNLMSNAVKFTHEGFIRISAEPLDTCEALDKPAGYEGGWIAIAVEDSGIGIDEQNLKVIFDEFWQVDGGPTRRYGGTGLGLSISRKLAGLLGGTITVSSIMGQGSTFTLILPADLDAFEHTQETQPDVQAAFETFLEDSKDENDSDN
ncbi:MAG: ATP-binding protein [Candidatus Alcyoniella australis]|nr:ATP-binding protein [Candidatus Alcyoniella australis]